MMNQGSADLVGRGGAAFAAADGKQQFSLWYFLIAFLAIRNFLFESHAGNLTYSEFKALLKAGKLDNVALGEEDLRKR